jgi:hypothetical protein
MYSMLHHNAGKRMVTLGVAVVPRRIAPIFKVT